MARKKSPSNSKATKQPVEDAEPGAEVEAPPAEANPAPKAARKQMEEQPGSGIGVADIKKAVSFANSVGGLDKAMSLLQILKVAKDVQ